MRPKLASIGGVGYSFGRIEMGYSLDTIPWRHYTARPEIPDRLFDGEYP